MKTTKVSKDQEGIVHWYNPRKGYGFIIPVADPTGPKVFVHQYHLDESGITQLVEAQEVVYDIEQGQYGKAYAANIRLKPIVVGYKEFEDG